MSINNEKNIEPLTELGLPLGYYSNLFMQRRRRFASDDSGAGANAGSGLNMTFVTNPLSELVWSPHKGPSNVALLPAHRISPTRNFAVHSRLIDEEDFLTLSTPSPMKSIGGGQVNGKDDVIPVRVPDREDEQGTCDDVSVSPINPNESIKDADRDSVSPRVEFRVDDKSTDTRENQFSGPKEPRAKGIVESPIDEERNVVGASEKKACSSAIATRVFHVPEKLESTSENDLNNLGVPNKAVVLELSRQVKVSSRLAKETRQTNETLIDRGVHVNRRKGKEKALSEGDLNALMSKNDDDESHESVESCNSARLFATTNKRRRSSEEGLVSDSKEMSKKQIMQCAPCTTPVAKQDSSFMNWISNMMKGFCQSVQEETAAPCPISIAGPSDEPENPNWRLVAFEGNRESPSAAAPKVVGFQSMFQSLYWSKLNVESQIGEESKEVDTSDNNGDPDGNSGQQLLLLNERIDESASGNEDNTKEKTNSKDNNGSDNNNLKDSLELMIKGKERTNSDSSLGKRKRSNSAEQADSEPQSPPNTTSKFSRWNDTLGSSWIIRFAPKIPSSSSNPDPLPALGNEIEKTTVMTKSHEDPTPLNPKHIISSRVSKETTCFFCGVKGHNLTDCSEVAESELDELLRNLESSRCSEEPSCFCIRCLQKDHWAVSCPKASLTKRFESESLVKEKENLKLESSKFCEGDGDLRMKTAFDWKVDEIVLLKETKSDTSLVHKHVTSSLVENPLRPNPIASLPFFVASKENPSVPRGLFDVVRRLRLSRSDIMKWMNSQTSVSHIEGFYLRLRLGKWEEGLGGTGYHVACIIAAQRDNKQKGTKSSLLVKVGGIKCLVESRYISNNDFLEDELMAWWCISSRNGDKIPSEEDLRIKVKTKRILGFQH